jgi:hypothetical protein
MSTNTKQNKTDAAKPAAATAAPSAAPKRNSRLPTEAVQKALKAKDRVVKDLADELKVPERDVRLAIDALRRKGENILRTAVKTFGYPKAATAAK